MAKRLEQALHTKTNVNGQQEYKKCSMLLVFRELQNKTTVRYCHVPTKMAKIKHADSIQYWQGCDPTGTNTPALLVAVYNSAVMLEKYFAAS